MDYYLLTTHDNQTVYFRVLAQHGCILLAAVRKAQKQFKLDDEEMAWRYIRQAVALHRISWRVYKTAHQDLPESEWD